MSTANYDLKQCLGFEYPPKDVEPLLSLSRGIAETHHLDLLNMF